MPGVQERARGQYLFCQFTGQVPASYGPVCHPRDALREHSALVKSILGAQGSGVVAEL